MEIKKTLIPKIIVPPTREKLASFRNRSLPIGYVHTHQYGTSEFLFKRMIEQVGVFKWVEPALSEERGREYNRFHSSDTLMDIVPNFPVLYNNPLGNQTEPNVDNYCLNNCLSHANKPRLFIGQSALSLLKPKTYIAETPFAQSNGKKILYQMKLTDEGMTLFPEAVSANMQNGSYKKQYVVQMENTVILRSYLEDDNIVPLAYIEHPKPDGLGRHQKHICAFMLKDSLSIGILYNPEYIEHLESSREFQNTGIRYGCIFFLSILKHSLEMATRSLSPSSSPSVK